MAITLPELEERFEEAAYTLKHVRVERGARGYGSSWPDVVRSAFTAYGPEDARPMRIVPSAAAISRMEECIDWLRLVDGEDARIIWLKAEGVQWRHICIRAGCVRQTAWRRWVASLQTIVNKVNHAERQAARAKLKLSGARSRG
ncbi:MAG TPA: DUF6362 family protein [Novosphingobium sp.]|jgi:hypothetical protein|nr:DUF6362 family protein [Novosphingobium sp.]